MLEKLIAEAETLAKKETGGHLTILRFTTGWKVFLGTPDLYGSSTDENGQTEGYRQIWNKPTFKTLELALQALLEPEAVFKV